MEIRPEKKKIFTGFVHMTSGSHGCDVNANCTNTNNTNGSHSCICKEGYTGKGESCQGKIKLYLEKSRITVHQK